MAIHGIKFGTKHTYDDWNLVSTSRPVINPPSPKTVYVDVPGADGSLDLTESLTGEVPYEMRKASFEFRVLGNRKWADVYSDIMDYLHGQYMEIILDDDPDYVYKGRATVDSWKSDKNYSLITIEISVEPYKVERFSSLEDWEWDAFNFESGVIREYADLHVDESLRVEISGTRKPVIPTFIVTSADGSGMKVRFENNYYDLKDGKNSILNITIKNKTYALTFLGTGTISIDYRGGRL